MGTTKMEINARYNGSSQPQAVLMSAGVDAADTGQYGKHRHQRHQNRQGLGFTVAGGDKVGDGSDALLFSDGDDLKQQGRGHHKISGGPR